MPFKNLKFSDEADDNLILNCLKAFEALISSSFKLERFKEESYFISVVTQMI